jgi:hypothetical protein
MILPQRRGYVRNVTVWHSIVPASARPGTCAFTKSPDLAGIIARLGESGA